MYESITYEELKSLPRDKKIEALKELKALYPTQKKIAEKLGVNPANIYNMIAKYMKEQDEGQLKAKAKAAKEPVVPAISKTEVKAEVKPEVKLAPSGPEKTRIRHVRNRKMDLEENLLITLSKSLTGEESQALFAGIGSTFLRNHHYRIEIRISEK